MSMKLSTEKYPAPQGLYQSLPKGCIRLLVLKIGTTTPPECYMEIMELSKAIERNFEALSYVWGEGSYNKSIMIHGHDFPVTQNLFDALLVLRQENSERFLWVDAVCINQRDDQEKEVQVPMMADIYKGAREVVAWLGNVDCETAPALQILAAVKSHNYLRAAGLCCAVPSDAYTALAAIMGREYWYRAWIVQEIAFARRLRIYCGLEWFPYESLKWALDTVPGVLSINVQADVTQAYALSPPTFPLRQLLPELLNQGKMDPEFYLHSLVDRHCGQPQDHVFAYFCLFPEEIQRRIKINYKSGPETVLLQAISAIIECTGSLTVLGIRSRQEVPDSLKDAWQETMPSWCPYVGRSFKQCTLAPSRVPLELGTVTGKPKYDIVTRRLQTFGLTIGTITNMVTYRVHKKRQVKKANRDKSTIRYLVNLGLSLPDCRGDCNGRHGAAATVGSTILEPEMLQLVTNVWNHTKNRRFCRFRSTAHDNDNHEKARLDKIALVPKAARKRDRICWIKGCLSAIVLREVYPTGDQDISFKVVGEAYVEGLDKLRLLQSIETFMLV